MLSIVLIGVSLSMDAFAISVSSGISIPGLRPFYAVRSSFFFGLFQFIMPVAGWFLGSTFAGYINAFDHWVVFALLAFIGGKMVFEELRGEDGKPESGGGDIRSMGTLLTLSAATSIDALAVGVSFSLLDQGIWLNAAIIGGVTLLICLAGFEFGRRIGRLFEKWAALAGGLMLIGIGTKILIEHLIAG
ncbi:putative manganese efflux pump MntP [Spirochaetia bacterium]|nr:putative manganese efflux pump MntP [Spirochaetia bacterium]